MSLWKWAAWLLVPFLTIQQLVFVKNSKIFLNNLHTNSPTALCRHEIYYIASVYLCESSSEGDGWLFIVGLNCGATC